MTRSPKDRSVGTRRFAIVFLLVAATVLGATLPARADSLNKCQQAVAKESARYVRAVADAAGGCLNKMSAAVIKGKDVSAAANQTAKSCVAALRKLQNSDDTTRQLSTRFDARLERMCDPATNPRLQHAETDTYTIGATTLSAANLNDYCRSFGGNGAIDSFGQWRDCVRTAADCEARQAIAARWPRALEHLAALGTAIAALPASTATSDALAALRSIEDAIEGPIDDNVPEPRCAPLAGHYVVGSAVTLYGGTLTTLATRELAAGTYLLWANVRISFGGSSANDVIRCSLGDSNLTHLPRATGADLATFSGHVTLSSPGAAALRCRVDGTGTYYASAATISAIGVDRLVQPAASCADGVQNQDESGVDCGGPCASACPPTCYDGIQNQGEAAVDCGGPCASVCPPTCYDGIQNQGEAAVDCGGPCAACPTCFDGIQNQGEAGIDCSNMGFGPCYFRCDGQPCDVPGDCHSGFCDLGTHTCEVPTCSDGAQNQGEEGIDCGGPCGAVCPPPTCSDGIQNQGETTVDCGGPCAACTCSDGLRNQGEAAVDCGGPFCPACPTCSDGAQNQGETDVDCGGPCPACPTCSDGIQNGGELGIDCGDRPSSPPCFTTCPGFSCPNSSWCSSGICIPEHPDTTTGVCSYPTCFDGVQNQQETSSDCGGPCPTCGGACPGRCVGEICGVGEQCESGSCAGVCLAPTCSDLIQNQGETNIDCGGPCGACSCNDGIRNQGETGVDCGGPCLLCNGDLCSPSNPAECRSGICNEIVPGALGFCFGFP